MAETIFIVINETARALIPVISVSDFANLQRTIIGKWPELASFELSFSCTVGKHCNCVVGDQGEYCNMLMLSEYCGVKFIEVLVIKESTLRTTITNPPTVNESLLIRPAPAPAPVKCTQQEIFAEKVSSRVNGIAAGQSSKENVPPYLMQPVYEMCPNLSVVKLLSDDWKHAIKGVGQVFRGGRKEFRDELVKYATKSGFQYTFDKNNKEYIYVVCAEKTTSNCGWFIRGKHFVSTGHFEIRKCNMIHDCAGTIQSNKTKRLGPKIISELVMENVRSRPTHPGTDMKDHLKLAYGVDVPYYKAWRAIDTAMGVMYGTFKRSYDQLNWYCEAVKSTNAGSHAWVECDEETKCFTQAFFAFKACLDAFKECRPMLFVDGTFMHGRTKATVLSAIAKDGNNGLVPVAFAIVMGETLANWTWFLQQLRDLVTHKENVFYVSDRNTGLQSAFEAVFGDEPNNFFCLYHLHLNLKSHYSGAWSTVRVFNEKVTKFLAEGGGLAKSFLDSIPPNKWAISHAPDVMRYGEMTSNAAESFNKWILEARALPVTFMVDTIRADLMRWFVERRNNANKWGSVLCEKRQDIWNYHVDLSTTWFVTKSSEFVYQVSSPISCKVDIKERTCTCCQWQIHGFPCAHAAAVVMKHCKHIEEVIDPCFLTTTYRKCYSGIIHPIPDTERFECKSYHQKATILAPPVKINPGRPNKKRKKSYGQVPRRKKKPCPSCGMVSRHDKFTCINNGGD